jgi:MFS transporter, MHS family, dicarboxylic acid transporter PcaT
MYMRFSPFTSRLRSFHHLHAEVPHQLGRPIDPSIQQRDDSVSVPVHVHAAALRLYTSISGIVKAELFPPNVRALGVGLSYAIANAIFGGSAEYVALGLKAVHEESAFYWYVTGMMVIVFLVSLRLPKQASYLRHDH